MAAVELHGYVTELRQPRHLEAKRQVDLLILGPVTGLVLESGHLQVLPRYLRWSTIARDDVRPTTAPVRD